MEIFLLIVGGYFAGAFVGALLAGLMGHAGHADRSFWMTFAWPVLVPVALLSFTVDLGARLRR